jgi:glycosyltransferase involved in cell wall biosynthesis
MVTKATIVEAHYQPAICWALDNLPTNIPLRIAFHTQPLGVFDDVSLLQQILSRNVMIQVPTEDLKGAYAALLSGDQRERFIKYTVVCPNVLSRAFCTSSANDCLQLREYGSPGHKIGIVTRLDNDKLSVPLLLNTIGELATKKPRISVAIAGPGEDSEEVKQAVRNSSVSRYIKFLGYVDEIEAVYRWADVLFLPSWTEVMPYAVLEAAFFKKPTVMPAIGECGRSVPDEYIKTFPPLDHISAASMIIGLLQDKSQYETRANDKDSIRAFHI